MQTSFALVSAALAVSLPLPGQAHAIYTTLVDSWGKSCCDEGDCRPVFYRHTQTGVQMLVEGRSIDVPPVAIQYHALPGDTGKTAGGHWCGAVHENYEPNLDPIYTTRCAILPPQATEADLERLGISER
jgi:hypothetical protein